MTPSSELASINTEKFHAQEIGLSRRKSIYSRHIVSVHPVFFGHLTRLFSEPPAFMGAGLRGLLRLPSWLSSSGSRRGIGQFCDSGVCFWKPEKQVHGKTIFYTVLDAEILELQILEFSHSNV